ncbi:hypothetical protein [uncultured Shewanella sp.]|uniref:hypothetical protein n=1 Tax=uncultured Shewanella sp. TaxID=173975 RepID=UPI002635325D|nr:hypothetical protein [uncultured Shewanella sp.]
MKYIGESATNNETNSVTYVETLDVAPYTISAMKATNYQQTATYPYTITYENPHDGETFEVKGQVEDMTITIGDTIWSDIGAIDPDSSLCTIEDGWLDAFGEKYHEKYVWDLGVTSS